MQPKDILVGVKASQLALGKPVPYPVYNKTGRLLFAKHKVLATQSQREHLVRDGLFLIEFPSNGQSVQDLITELKLNLAKAFKHMDKQRHEPFVRQVMQLALDIQHHCDKQQDALLGAVHADHGAIYWQIHPIHCAVMCEIVAKHISMPQLERVSLLCAALTQNIGFYKVQEELHNKTEALSEDEAQMIRQHPMRSYQMLVEAGVNDNFWLDAVRNHHERIDGSGYPFGLKEFLVSTPSKIIAIADIYAAATRSRNYSDATLSRDAMQEIFNERGKSVCEHLTKSFVSQVSIYPPGTYVQLSNKEIGIVQARTEEMSKPKVGVVIDSQGNLLKDIVIRHSSESKYTIVQVLPFSQYKKLDSYLPQLWPKFTD